MVEYLDGPAADPAASPQPLISQTWQSQRPFRSVEIASNLRVAADKPTALNYVLVPPQIHRRL